MFRLKRYAKKVYLLYIKKDEIEFNVIKVL